MKHYNLLTIILSAVILSACGSAKHTKVINHNFEISHARNVQERYILTYYPMAVEQMERHKVPASITLAQGVLESGAGNSELCKESNNHFCIKADSRWKGAKVKAKDRGGDFYFRAYRNAYESYEDHSKFLRENTRYSKLFDLKLTDYKGWAKELKRAGYAEDEMYPSKLIGLIERYELYKYDRYSSKNLPHTSGNVDTRLVDGKHNIFKSSELIYIIAKGGDTFKSLAKETGVSRRKLIKYNDLYKGYTIKDGDIIYLQKKHKRAQKPYEFHTTAAGESLYSISQRYGIRLERLFKMNPQFKSYAKLKVGDIVRLR